MRSNQPTEQWTLALTPGPPASTVCPWLTVSMEQHAPFGVEVKILKSLVHGHTDDRVNKKYSLTGYPRLKKKSFVI